MSEDLKTKIAEQLGCDRDSVDVDLMLQAIKDAGYDLVKPEDPEALTVADYEEVLADHRRLVKELDRLLNGDAGAERPSLCDIVGQLRDSSFALADLRTHVIVPREPTEAMIKAGSEAFDGYWSEDHQAGLIYRSMLTASQREGDGK